MDEVELAEAAIFSLNQGARRLRTLSEQAQSPALRAQLAALADVLDEHARQLHRHRRSPA